MSDEIIRKYPFVSPDTMRAKLHTDKNLFNGYTKKSFGTEARNGTKYVGDIQNWGSEMLLESRNMRLNRPPLGDIYPCDILKTYFEMTYDDNVNSYDQENALMFLLRKNALYHKKIYIKFTNMEEHPLIRSNQDSSTVAWLQWAWRTTTPPTLCFESDDGETVNEYPLVITSKDGWSPIYWFQTTNFTPDNQNLSQLRPNESELVYYLIDKDHYTDTEFQTLPFQRWMEELPFLWVTFEEMRTLPELALNENNYDADGLPIFVPGSDGNGHHFLYLISNTHRNLRLYEDHPELGENEKVYWQLRFYAKHNSFVAGTIFSNEQVRTENLHAEIRRIQLIAYHQQSTDGIITDNMFLESYDINIHGNFKVTFVPNGMTVDGNGFMNDIAFRRPRDDDFDFDGENYKNNVIYGYIDDITNLIHHHQGVQTGYDSLSYSYTGISPMLRIIPPVRKYDALDVRTYDFSDWLRNNSAIGIHVDYTTDYSENAVSKRNGTIFNLGNYDGLPKYYSYKLPRTTHRPHVELYGLRDKPRLNDSYDAMAKQTATVILDAGIPQTDYDDILSDMKSATKFKWTELRTYYTDPDVEIISPRNVKSDIIVIKGRELSDQTTPAEDEYVDYAVKTYAECYRSMLLKQEYERDAYILFVKEHPQNQDESDEIYTRRLTSEYDEDTKEEYMERVAASRVDDINENAIVKLATQTTYDRASTLYRVCFKNVIRILDSDVSKLPLWERIVYSRLSAITPKLYMYLNKLNLIYHGKRTFSTGMMGFDPFLETGRVYYLSNDGIEYENNKKLSEQEQKPPLTMARIADIPTRMDQLIGIKYVAPTIVIDENYVRTEVSFTKEDRDKINQIVNDGIMAKGPDGKYVRWETINDPADILEELQDTYDTYEKYNNEVRHNMNNMLTYQYLSTAYPKYKNIDPTIEVDIGIFLQAFHTHLEDGGYEWYIIEQGSGYTVGTVIQTYFAGKLFRGVIDRVGPNGEAFHISSINNPAATYQALGVADPYTLNYAYYDKETNQWYDYNTSEVIESKNVEVLTSLAKQLEQDLDATLWGSYDPTTGSLSGGIMTGDITTVAIDKPDTYTIPISNFKTRYTNDIKPTIYFAQNNKKGEGLVLGFELNEELWESKFRMKDGILPNLFTFATDMFGNIWLWEFSDRIYDMTDEDTYNEIEELAYQAFCDFMSREESESEGSYRSRLHSNWSNGETKQNWINYILEDHMYAYDDEDGNKVYCEGWIKKYQITGLPIEDNTYDEFGSRRSRTLSDIMVNQIRTWPMYLKGYDDFPMSKNFNVKYTSKLIENQFFYDDEDELQSRDVIEHIVEYTLHHNYVEPDMYYVTYNQYFEFDDGDSSNVIQLDRFEMSPLTLMDERPPLYFPMNHKAAFNVGYQKASHLIYNGINNGESQKGYIQTQPNVFIYNPFAKSYLEYEQFSNDVLYITGTHIISFYDFIDSPGVVLNKSNVTIDGKVYRFTGYDMKYAPTDPVPYHPNVYDEPALELFKKPGDVVAKYDKSKDIVTPIGDQPTGALIPLSVERYPIDYQWNRDAVKTQLMYFFKIPDDVMIDTFDDFHMYDTYSHMCIDTNVVLLYDNELYIYDADTNSWVKVIRKG